MSSVSGRAGPPCNKDLFLPGRTLGLETEGSLSNSELPPARPGHTQAFCLATAACGTLTMRPCSSLGSAPAPAASLGGGSASWGRLPLPVSRKTRALRVAGDGHLPVGSPLELGGDLLRAKHVFLRQGRQSARSRAGFPLGLAHAEPTRTLGLCMGCSSDLRGAALLSPASLSLSGSSLGWDLPLLTAVCLAALLDFPHLFSICLVPREGELHGSKSCLVHARPQSAARCLAQEGHSRI